MISYYRRFDQEERNKPEPSVPKRQLLLLSIWQEKLQFVRPPCSLHAGNSFCTFNFLQYSHSRSEGGGARGASSANRSILYATVAGTSGNNRLDGVDRCSPGSPFNNIAFMVKFLCGFPSENRCFCQPAKMDGSSWRSYKVTSINSRRRTYGCGCHGKSQQSVSPFSFHGCVFFHRAQLFVIQRHLA